MFRMKSGNSFLNFVKKKIKDLGDLLFLDLQGSSRKVIRLFRLWRHLEICQTSYS